MKLTRFKNDTRLWICLSSILFIASWWFPTVSDGRGMMTCVSLVGDLLQHSKLTKAELRAECIPFVQSYVRYLLMLLSVFAVVAILLGWTLQCAIVLLRTKTGTQA